jgi:hypothetical protein
MVANIAVYLGVGYLAYFLPRHDQTDTRRINAKTAKDSGVARCVFDEDLAILSHHAFRCALQLP